MESGADITVGPADGLRGEVTLYDGIAYVSTIDATGKEVVTTGTVPPAIFLAYGGAASWTPIPVDRRIEGLDQAEAFVREWAETQNLPLERGFPFRFEGRMARLSYHVIFLPNDAAGPHSSAAHQQAKTPFSADGELIRIAGVWVPENQVGEVTHPGRRTHLHVVREAARGSGHVDDLIIEAGATLFLPARDS
ncbi:MAG: acetolactate decarboxylase [Pacificimonas sp.]